MQLFTTRMRLTYRRCLEQPVLILAVLLLLSIASVRQLPNLSFDASADSLIAKDDPELAFYDKMVKTFGESSFLVLTYTPKTQELLSKPQVEALQSLAKSLSAIDAVASVQSLLDAPLLASPPVPLAQLADDYRTLLSADVDLALAKKELTQSPLFKNLLISADGQTTAMRINLRPDDQLIALRSELAALPEGDPRQGELERKVAQRAKIAKAEQQEAIDKVRSIRAKFESDAVLYLGGVPMVASDMIRMVREDMAVFASVIVGLLVIALYGFFRRWRWVIFPLSTSALTILFMLGLLGGLRQPITAVSANFVALLAIVTISFTIHLITRYNELFDEFKDDPRQCRLSFETMRSKLAPCIYTGLTTIVAFASLFTSNIVPVVDFGWIMCVGIVVSLMVTYSFFASVLVLLPKNEKRRVEQSTPALTKWFAKLSTQRTSLVLWSSLFVIGIAGYGITQLTVGDRLVEYFRSDTEIRQGLDYIDKELGGTVPLDIVLQFDPYVAPDADISDGQSDGESDGE